MSIISIINHKGGVGKSTCTVNLSDALSKKGKKVLVIDNDPQSNSTSKLIKTHFKNSLFDVYDPEEKINILNIITPSKLNNVDIIPNLSETGNLEPTLIQGQPNSFLILKDFIRNYAKENYDYTIIDNPPNMGTFILMSLFTSDFVLIPIGAQSIDSVQGLNKALETINQIRESGQNKNLKFLRVLINGLDRRTGIGSIITNLIKQTFKDDEIFKTIIPINTVIERAEAHKNTIFQEDSTSTGAKAYRSLAKELIRIT